MDGRTKLTKEFLNCVAKHLSGRSECRGVTYRIVIGVEDNAVQHLFNLKGYAKISFEDYAMFLPHVLVFPDRYHKKVYHKLPILDHVLLYHFQDTLYKGHDDKGNIKIRTDALIPGVYEYQPSVDMKRRRWVRVK